MDMILVLARNITRAQRMAEVLRRRGIRCRWRRAPAEMGESGCAYAVEISQEELAEARDIWRQAGFAPLRMWRRGADGWEEMAE